MGILRFRMFGKFQLESGAPAPCGSDAHNKPQELFCYLLFYRQQPHHREVLAELLCNGCTLAQSRRSLRQTLWRLQSAMECLPELEGRPLLLADAEWVQLNPEAEYWLDVAEFERAFAAVRSIPVEQLGPDHVLILQAAESLYQGDLLEGCYQEWCLYERERLQRTYLALLNRLLAYSEAQGQYETGILYGERILHFDRANERAHQHLMRLRYLAGDRSGALRQYERCVLTLREELNVEPSARTAALNEQIRAERLSSSTGIQPDPALADALTSSSPDEVLHRLEKFQALLADTQERIQQQIQTLNLILEGRA